MYTLLLSLSYNAIIAILFENLIKIVKWGHRRLWIVGENCSICNYTNASNIEAKILYIIKLAFHLQINVYFLSKCSFYIRLNIIIFVISIEIF